METTNKLIKAALRAYPDSRTIKALCESLEVALGINRQNLTIKQNLADDIKRLSEHVAELQTICAESYQVVGALADEAGVFETSDAVSKALDNLSQAKLVHKDVLPFVLPENATVEPASQNQQLLEQMISDLQKMANPQNPTIPPMSPECFRQHAAIGALQAILANPQQGGSSADIARYAVNHADALIQELAK